MGEALAGRRRWVWAAVAVVVLALIGFGVVRALRADADEEPAAAATVAVDRGAVTTEVATTGTIQPAQTRSLSFTVAGTVETISVRPGTTVTAGQALATVDDTDAAEAVDNARSALDDAEDALTEAEDNAAGSSTTPTTCAANVAAAYTSPSRSPSVSPSPTTVTPSPTATAKPTPTTSPTATRKPTATASPDASRSAAPTRTGKTPEGGDCAASGGAKTGQQQGGDAILGAQQRVTQARTTLENAEEALAGATIKAPIAGRILSVSGKVGSQVTAGNAFITLADVYDMQISAAFPEADSDRLALTQKAVVTLADRAGDEFKATVVQVDPVGTSDGTMVRYGVLLAFDTAPEDLLVGQSAAVRVTTGAKAEVLRVPSTAVHDVSGDQGTVLKNGARTKVVVGLRGDQFTEITGGLADGDEVVRSW